MKHLFLLTLSILCLIFSTTKVVQAQENSDWWHTDYESQTPVGGSSQSPATTAETLPVAGTVEITYAILSTGLVFIALGVYIQKRLNSHLHS